MIYQKAGLDKLINHFLLVPQISMTSSYLSNDKCLFLNHDLLQGE